MPDKLAETRRELAVANQILARENIVDAFGHISMRHPNHPDRYLITTYRAPERVVPSSIIELTLDSKPVTPTSERLFSELVIHGEVYKARPDVQSVCHHHSVAILPYCITGVELVPVMHLGATMGDVIPFWDSRDEFGDTRLLLTKPEEGASMARALGPHWTVLLRRHGATVAGRSLRECVFRSIYGCRNAELQTVAMGMGTLGPQATLTDGERRMCSEGSLNDRTLWRAWDYWSGRLPKGDATSNGTTRPTAARATAARKSKRAKPAKRMAGRSAARGRKKR
ncbi:MAG: class II aldolase/adducin family protein [Xanthobacteraceae bacterium]